jgi:hypothetical protein
MTLVRQATRDDLDLVFPLFKGFATQSQVNPEDWKKIFEKLWDKQDPCCGYVLINGKEAVGFLGTIFSKRLIKGIPRDFCNLTSWIVKPDYRSESLSLLFPLMGRKDLTLTNFTASNRVIDVLLKVGFKSLEDHYRMILPIPLLTAGCKVYFDTEIIENILQGDNLRIFLDHKKLHCRHILLEFQNDQCYLVLNPARKRNLPVMFVDYISNLDFFMKYIQRYTFSICKHLQVFGLMTGEHNMRGSRFPLALRIKRRHALLYRSKDVPPENIDTLYSEIQVLGLKPV